MGRKLMSGKIGIYIHVLNALHVSVCRLGGRRMDGMAEVAPGIF